MSFPVEDLGAYGVGAAILAAGRKKKDEPAPKDESPEDDPFEGDPDEPAEDPDAPKPPPAPKSILELRR